MPHQRCLPVASEQERNFRSFNVRQAHFYSKYGAGASGGFLIMRRETPEGLGNRSGRSRLFFGQRHADPDDSARGI